MPENLTSTPILSTYYQVSNQCFFFRGSYGCINVQIDVSGSQNPLKSADNASVFKSGYPSG
jgi:hypothetical protein